MKVAAVWTASDDRKRKRVTEKSKRHFLKCSERDGCELSHGRVYSEIIGMETQRDRVIFIKSSRREEADLSRSEMNTSYDRFVLWIDWIEALFIIYVSDNKIIQK